MKSYARHPSWIAVVAAMLAVAGCGGGGGDEDVIEDQIEEEGADVADVDGTDRQETDGVADGIPDGVADGVPDGDQDQDAVEDQVDDEGDGAEVLKANGETCESGDECQSLNCVDGVCCGEVDCPGDCNVCDAPGSEGTCSNAPDGQSCDDVVYCNGADQCLDGACDTHGGDPCPGPDDDDDCAESCDETAGSCTANDPVDSLCNDGIFCNGADQCLDGVCSIHAGDPCPGPDGDGDCAETCDETAGSCTGDDPLDSSCNDGIFCNGIDQCRYGACSAHGGDPCPGPDGDDNCAESCDEITASCTGNDPNDTTCDDTLFCTGTDLCLDGACLHSGNTCLPPQSCDEPTDSCIDVWINELHYDDTLTDSNEGVEIAGPAGTDLDGWFLYFYNGASGLLSGAPLSLRGVIRDQQAGYGAIWFPRGGIENGSPDGLALVDPANVVVMFLSYEGTFAAAEGPANGMTSVDIGPDEDPPTPEDYSLQLRGNGNSYADFVWGNPAPITPDRPNLNQNFI